GTDALTHARLIDLHVTVWRVHPVRLVDRDQHQEARGGAHQRVRAEARRAAVVRALVADQRAGRERGEEAHRYFIVARVHQCYLTTVQAQYATASHTRTTKAAAQ